MEQVPEKFSGDDIVFLAGHEEPGVSQLKALISQLNRDKDWVQVEWKKEIQSVPNRASIVLVMAGVSSGTLANIRKSAIKRDIILFKQALSTSETASVLKKLGELRKHSTSNNGNGDGRKEKITPTQTDVKISPEEVLVGNGGTTTSPVTTQTKSRVDIALETIARFRSCAEETELAVMEIAEELSSADSRLTSVQEELEKEKERVRELTKDKEKLENENSRLQGESSRLQTILDNVINLTKDVKGG